MDLKDWKVHDVRKMLDMEEDSEMKMRNTTYTIPAGTKRIFTANSSGALVHS